MDNKNISLFQSRTLNELKTVPAELNDVIYCSTTETLYRYVTNSNTTDDKYLVATLEGGTNKWSGIGGKYNTLPNVLSNKCGFENQTDSTISYNHLTGVFTLTPVDLVKGYNVYVAGEKYNITDVRTVSHSIGNVSHSGQYYIYFNGSGVLTILKSDGSNFPTLGTIAIVSIVWYDGENLYGDYAEERHSCYIDSNLHTYFHLTRGLVKELGCTISGITLSGNTTQSNLFGLSDGKINDDGLRLNVAQLVKGDTAVNYNVAIPGTATKPYTVIYRNGVGGNWFLSVDQYVPFRYTANSYIHYDNNGSSTVATATNQYINYYVFVTNFQNKLRYFSIMGQTLHTSTTTAYAETILNLNLTGLNLPEAICIYQITYRTGNYNPIGRCRVERYIDVNQTFLTVSSGLTSTSNHLSLTNINGGVYGDGGHTNLTVTVPSTTNPTINDDVTNYKIGTIWINTISDEKFILVDNTDGAAIWKNISSGGISSGCVTTPTYIDNGNGTITMNNVDVHLHSSATFIDGIRKYTLTGLTFSSLVDNSMNYIIGDYNGGTPVMRHTTNVNEINESTIIPILTILRTGTNLHIVSWDTLGLGLSNKLHQSIVKTQRYRRESGLELVETTNREFNILSGKVWSGATSFSLAQVNSNTDVLFFYYHVGGSWTFTTSSNEYNNTQYDNGTDLVTSSNNKYLINWIFRGVENYSHIYKILGNAEYTLEEAMIAKMPTPPTQVSSHAILVGRIIVKYGLNVAQVVQSAFDVTFNSAVVSDHGDLLNRDVAGNHAKLVPLADTTTAIQITKADGTTSVMTVDTIDQKIVLNQKDKGTISGNLITIAGDSDFSSVSGNWTGTNWTIGGGVYSHTAGANVAQLNNYAAPTSGRMYIIIVTFTTTTAGTLRFEYGNAVSSYVGQNVGTITNLYIGLLAAGVSPLIIRPNSTWVGSIDSIALYEILTYNTSALLVKNANNIGTLDIITTGDGYGFGFGQHALRCNTSGNYNMAFGLHALRNNTIGNYNMAIGVQSLLDNVNGSYNTAIGYQSLFKKYLGDSNTAIGAQSLTSLVSGISNTAIGRNSLRGLIYGDNNISIGLDAGRYYSSGTSLITTSNRSIFIGGDSRSNANNSINEIVIGYGTIGNGDNTTTIGNTTTYRTQINSTQMIVRTSTSNDVVFILRDNKIGNLSRTSIEFRDANDNRIGVIGATGSDGELHLSSDGNNVVIDKSTKINGDLLLFNGDTTASIKHTITDSSINIVDDQTLYFDKIGEFYIKNDSGDTTFVTNYDGALGLLDGAIYPLEDRVSAINITKYDRVSSILSADTLNSRIGIGSTSPTAKLHVNNSDNQNSLLIEDSTNPDATPFVITADGSIGIGTTSPDENMVVVSPGANSRILKILDSTETTPIYALATSSAEVIGQFLYNSGDQSTFISPLASSYFKKGLSLGWSNNSSSTQYSRMLSVVGNGIENVGTGLSALEVLSNGSLIGGTNWTSTNDATLTSDKAIFTFSTGLSSYINQSSASFTNSMKASTWYGLTITFANSTTNKKGYARVTINTDSSVAIISAINGTATHYFKTQSTTPTIFRLSTTLTSGQGFEIDDISVKEVTDAALYTGGGTTGLTVSSTGLIAANTINYENLVVNDNDIPNKKYVDTHGGGSEILPTVTATGLTLNAASHLHVFCTNTSDITHTLPTASSNNGKKFLIKNKSTGLTTISRSGTDLIDGLTSYLLSTQYSYVELESDGTSWNVIREG